MTFGKTLILGLVLSLASCAGSEPAPEPAAEPTPTTLTVATPIGDMIVPADNPMTPEKIELGKQLFFDKRLGKDGMMSCETCHLPEMGWTDGKQFSTKADGTANTRHTPTLYNVGFYEQWYWDGRAPTLEAQVRAAWTGQMGGDPEQVAMTLNGIEGYSAAFQAATGGPATPDSIVDALATFVRTIRSEDSPWDRYEAGDKAAVSKEAIAGFEMARGEKANCLLCHVPPEYTDANYHNVGIGYDKENPDMGRGAFLQKNTDPQAEAMMGAFKTPTLRSLPETGPYFHDGRAATLDEAVTLMLNGGIDNPNKDEKLQRKELTAPEKRALMAWLQALTPERTPFERPTLP